ncbi:hypothetical protein SISNIDRAFT_483839 [Sistotremastrum niveocremeum HHB9708]|uniref:Uncharacterized protein n=1 Tax=Sistotremastrum niveocremeum HHB9708 TaxID=1314777 RepID=A0A164X407_9AGAM|nr:hypothetical protein SISNIDRAFT_483839 [Sistotremastrum niveocremeum HHB9708]
MSGSGYWFSRPRNLRIRITDNPWVIRVQPYSIVGKRTFTTAPSSTEGDFSEILDPSDDPELILSALDIPPPPTTDFNMGLPLHTFQLPNREPTFLEQLTSEDVNAQLPVAGIARFGGLNIQSPDYPVASTSAATGASAHRPLNPSRLRHSTTANEVSTAPTAAMREPAPQAPGADSSRKQKKASTVPRKLEQLRRQQASEPEPNFWDMVGLSLKDWLDMARNKKERTPSLYIKGTKFERLLCFLQQMGFKPEEDDLDLKQSLPGLLSSNEYS